MLAACSEKLCKKKNVDSAIIYYEKAVRYFPDEEDLQLTLGNLYSENKNYDKAIKIFDLFDKKYGVNENSTVSSIRTLVIAVLHNFLFFTIINSDFILVNFKLINRIN